MKKKWITLLVLVIAIGAGVTLYLRSKPAEASNTLITAPVTRGDVVETVQTTGTLQAVTTVQVGTQVSGTISALHADFNSQVKAGQVVAQIEPSLFQAQVEQAKATLTRLEADRDRAKVQVEDAALKLKRAKELSARQLIPAADLETAQSNSGMAVAALQSAEAQIVQAKASLHQNQVNLDYTVIKAPIDGIVVSRNVDVGQTVAASMQAPVIFTIANNLSEMQVSASVDESDIGRIRPGQTVTFRVDAYPDERFGGTVQQVRLQPVVSQNVVSYTTIINVPNPEQKLKPGMTANVTVEIARANNVLRVPSGALRFRPTAEVFASLGQSPPAGFDGQGRGGRGQFGGGGQTATSGAGPTAGAQPPAGSASPSAAAPQATAQAPAAAPAANAAKTPDVAASQQPGQQEAGGRRRRGAAEAGAAGGEGEGRGGGRFGNMTPEQREQFRQRMQNMSPEERQQMRARFAGGDSQTGDQAGAQAGAARGGRRAARGGGQAPAKATAPGTPPPPPAAPRPVPRAVWALRSGKLERVGILAGITDGALTAAMDGPLNEGDQVVTGVSTPQATAQSGAGNPLMPSFGRGGPGGNRGFGGAGGGGGARPGGGGR